MLREQSVSEYWLFTFTPTAPTVRMQLPGVVTRSQFHLIISGASTFSTSTSQNPVVQIITIFLSDFAVSYFSPHVLYIPPR
ncbi:hypothetical protein E2C01_053980 [Portunus trituberculatus]|uniref:Uncharacterized protein n=1 Tax=Portunus trituberculatus TaxID=210409 RepID=A0A5B7GRX8_PORTR|nr:hypothetical protein [Portunus trituberculatus]